MRMKTLIELYDDERPIENVLATEVFGPEETVYICPPEVMQDRALKSSLKKYFARRGCPTSLSFVQASLLDAAKVEKALHRVIGTHEDCALDISGGTDAALFAAGSVSGDIPVFTYSHKRNTFYDIRNAPFARSLPCTLKLNAEACFLMAGGELLPGREDNAKLRDRLPQIDRLFAVYSDHRRVWNRQVSYIQRISDANDSRLMAEGPRTVKADNSLVTADGALLRDLEKAGLILDLRMEEETVAFRFPDEVVRFWLRDMGSVLELHVFRACLAAECFDDVVLSAVVNWQGGRIVADSVTNEIDVMAVRGIRPLFISCKTCEIKTEALNELAILRDRFGGKSSRAMIVTSAAGTKSRAAMRSRAAELGIEIVEWGDMALPNLIDRLNG